jgi:nitroreductase/iron-sulfur cluster repair protein YtfE (RIC family)
MFEAMAHQLTEPLLRRHDSLRPRVMRIAEVAREIPSLGPRERRAVVAETLEFLRGELRLHAEAEERWLYPEIALQLHHPMATAGMRFDHELLREQSSVLEAVDIHDAPALQAALYGLHALLDAHFRKEEHVYLPFLEEEHEAGVVVAIEQAMTRYEHGEPEPTRRSEIDLERHDFPSTGLPVEQLAYLLRYAVRAPSSHNTQPWRFKLAGDAVEFFADRTRALPVVDHDDRELVISCGAALLTLRTAIRHHGFEDDVQLLPDESEPDLLARIRLGTPRRPTMEEKHLFWAIAKRHTNRHAFEDRPVPPELVEELERAAESEGVRLGILESDEQRQELADLVAEADRRQFADPRFRRELASWINRNRTRDGMPAHALELPMLVGPFAPLVVRTFDVGKGAAAHDRAIAHGSPVLAVLNTAGDTPRDWLAAGQALALVLLRAAHDDVSASFLNQPVEVEELRAEVGRLVGGGVPQIVVRLGYGPVLKPTPRRPLGEVVILDAPA